MINRYPYKFGFTIIIAIILFGCHVNGDKYPYADVLYYNAQVIAMTGPDDLHEAIAIKDGKILAIGKWVDVSKYEGERNKGIDLKGGTILPGFIDGHSHFMMGMELADYVNLWSPPFGNIEDIPGILSALENHKKNNQLQSGEWIMSYGYDPDLLTEGRHPTKFDLDKSFPDNPVFLAHVSGHMGVANSEALKIFGFNKETPNPQGGEIERIEGSKEPNGRIRESVMQIAKNYFPKPDASKVEEQFKKVQDYYASCGITTAQDGFTYAYQLDIAKKLNDADQLKMDLVSLVGFTELDTVLSDPSNVFGVYNKRLKLGGIKLIADGSPQGKTALMKDPYLTEVPGCAHDCKGIAVLPPAMLNGLVKRVYNEGIQLYTHCNGDAAIDMFLDAHNQAVESLDLDSKELRSVVIHSQFMRPDFIKVYADLGLIPSYFTNHTFFWGDVHMQNMGIERASFTSPINSSIEAGITFTNHTDYPITPQDQLYTVWTAVNRISRSGQIIGPDERVTPYEALKAITINGAFQYGEEVTKGTLEVGKIADLVILSGNPLKFDPTKIKDIEVLTTLKSGDVIYSKK